MHVDREDTARPKDSDVELLLPLGRQSLRPGLRANFRQIVVVQLCFHVGIREAREVGGREAESPVDPQMQHGIGCDTAVFVASVWERTQATQANKSKIS